MKYLGCQKKSGNCDQCGAAQEYLHSMEGGAHLCKACAEKKTTPRGDRAVPRIAEEWSRKEAGRWVSRWYVEEVLLP
jgi:hypothetical protein